MRNLEPLIFGLILAVVMSVFTAGCHTFAIVNEHEFSARISVKAATARVLRQHPSWKADAVAITGAAMEMIDQQTLVDLASVEAYVKNKISWVRLLPEEQEVLSELISEARLSIEDNLRTKNIERPELQLVEVRKLLGWINETAKRQTL